MNELALFAGAGGGILGGHLLGWRCVCAVERDAYAAAVLAMRQNDGSLPAFPIWSDVESFDGKPWRGIVDVISGGFPCQDISTAGKGAGITGSRSGLWKEFARIIGEVGPRYVLVENSPALTGRGMGVVLGDLAALGYDARWGVLGAVDAGAPHKRERIWIVADHHGLREQQPRRTEPDEREWYCDGGEESGSVADSANNGIGWRQQQPQGSEGAGHVADSDEAGCSQQWSAFADGAEHEAAECGGWWLAEPALGRVAHGVAHRVDRLAALGNGQVPAVVRLAWEILTENNEHKN